MNEKYQSQFICTCLEKLVDSKRKDSDEFANKNETFFHYLKLNIKAACNELEKQDKLKTDLQPFIESCLHFDSQIDIYWTFLELCLFLLKLLDNNLSQEKLETSDDSSTKGLLSISQQKVLQKSLQFIVALGILPSLIPGVGASLEQRSQYGVILDTFTHEFTPQQNHRRLVTCLKIILCFLNHDSLQSFVLTYHGSDLLAALFQLCYAPIKKIPDKETMPDKSGASEIPSSLINPNISFKNYEGIFQLIDFTPCSDCKLIEEMLKDRNFFKPCLEKLLKQMSPSLLMWELLLLKGISLRNTKLNSRKTPKWLQKITLELLTNMILQQNGIPLLIQGILDKVSDIQTGCLDKTTIEAIARLITNNPVKHLTLEEYVKKLSNQVLHLLNLDGSSLNTLLSYTATCIILQFCDCDYKLAKKYFLDDIFKLLWQCIDSSNENIEITEESLTLCIENIYKVFVCNISGGNHIKLLLPFFHCFCCMLYFLQSGKSFLRSKVKSLLLVILNNLNENDALMLFYTATFNCKKNPEVYLTQVEFTYGDNGGICVIPIKHENVVDQDNQCDAILELLGEVQNKKLKTSYILLLLKELTTQSFINELSSNDELSALKCNLLILLIFQEFSEKFPDAFVADIVQAVDFILVIFENLNKPTKDESCLFGIETYKVALTILNSVVEFKDQLNFNHWSSLERCIPGLKKLQNFTDDKLIQNMTENLIIQIATHGVAGFDIKNMPSSDETTTKNNFQKETKETIYSKNANEIPRIENDLKETNSKLNETDVTKSEQVKSINDKSSPSKDSPYESAIKDLQDPLLPVRGHGLISICKLLKDKDPQTIANKKKLLEIFQENLKDGDTYIYPKAIEGHKYLADMDVELVLPIILDMYLKPDEHECEHFLKIGEIFMKICQLLGGLIFNYRDKLLHACLCGTKHKDPIIRASCLSNLGETVKLLKFSIQNYWLQEILLCAKSFLKTDPVIEVRRSALMVITLLLQGMEKDAFKILESELKDIYSLLRLVYNTEKDDVLRLHSQIALEEINLIVKSILCAKVPLVKEIKIF